MRVVSIIAAVVLVALIALTLVPETSAYHTHLLLASLAVAALLLLAILLDRRGRAEPRPVVAEAAKPPTIAGAANQADAEVVGFLAALQEKGRLIDFLMDDLTAYRDAQVGAAARVVHEGCKAVLQEHFSIRPVREESEGSAVTVAAGYAADEYRLVGKISGEAPFSGRLVHRGWKTERVKLPRVIRSGDRLPTIAPAEVELT
jgi:Domain of unknown function (DUF2760)